MEMYQSNYQIKAGQTEPQLLVRPPRCCQSDHRLATGQTARRSPRQLLVVIAAAGLTTPMSLIRPSGSREKHTEDALEERIREGSELEKFPKHSAFVLDVFFHIVRVCFLCDCRSSACGQHPIHVLISIDPLYTKSCWKTSLMHMTKILSK